MKNIVLLITLLSTLSFSEHITTIFQNGTYGYNGCEDVGISLHATFEYNFCVPEYYRAILNTPDTLKNYNGSSNLSIIGPELGFGYSRFLIRFNNITDTIPENSVIVDAKITLISTDASASGYFSPLMTDWNVDEATWLESRDGEYWPVDSTQYTNPNESIITKEDKVYHGGLFDPDVVTSSYDLNTDSKSQQYPGKLKMDVDVTEAIQQMVDGKRENYGFLGFRGGCVHRSIYRSKYRINSSYSSETVYPPKLIIIYDPDSIRVNTVQKRTIVKPFLLIKSDGFTTLNFTCKGNYDISIFDVLGKELKAVSFSGTKIKLTHNKFSKGLHIISIIGESGDTFREMVIF